MGIPKHISLTLSKTAVPQLPGRSVVLDALRTLSILAMIAAHTTRMIEPDLRHFWSAWALLAEPLIPATFLFLMGASLVVSNTASQNKWTWFRRQVLRSLQLWVVSTIFYFAEEGFHWPDLFVASGILTTIAYSLVIISALICLPFSFIWLGIFLVGGSIVHWVLGNGETPVFYLRNGNSPILPLILFALGGALLQLGLQQRPTTWQRLGRVLMALFAVSIVGYCLFHYGFTVLFSKPIGRIDAARIFESTHGLKRIGYYSYRPILSLFCFSIPAFLLLFGHGPNYLKNPFSKLDFSLAMGRHALLLYIVHLSLLASAVFFTGHLRPFTTPWMGEVALVGLLILCQGLAWSLDFSKTRLSRVPVSNPANS